MKIHIEELGAIKEAKINLDKPLILFCGQNNTGKTYLAFIMYALAKNRIRRNHLKINVPDLIEKGFFSFEINIDQVFEYKKQSIKEVKANLNTIFGISDELAEQMFAAFKISFGTEKNHCKEKIENFEIIDTLRVSQNRFKITKKVGDLNVKIELIEGEDYSNILKDQIFEIILSSFILNRIAFYPISSAVIFPVERNSIYTFSKELSISRNLLIDQMQKLSKGSQLDPFDFINNSSNRYPLAIRDGLVVSNDLQNIQKKKSAYFDVATEIEENLLNGTLSITKEGDVQFVSNKNKTKKLPIHMTASIVKTMSSLVFYLKYVAEKSDLIIIDEPEMNLHPDSQIVLTRVFGKLLSKGFRLLISTHSDYIIREFNNLIMTSHKNEEVAKVIEECKYDPNDSISPENVACYYFHFPKSSSKQVVVKELTVDKNGFEIESIDKEINAQNDRAMALNFAINNGTE